MTHYNYPAPTESPFFDFCQYIPLLISAVQEELDRDEVWQDSEVVQARGFMQELYRYLMQLECSGIMDYSKSIAFTQADSGTLTLDSVPAANGVLLGVVVIVDSANLAGFGTLQIGISGDTDLYQTVNDNNLTILGAYETFNYQVLGASPAAIIATISANGQSFAGRIILRYARL